MRYFVLLLLLSACAPRAAAPTTADAGPPNILVIMADDLGYTDIGAFGSEIPTPNIDAIAVRGARFSGLHAAPKCAPSRAMFWSGNDSHVAGYGRMFVHERDKQFRGLPGYEGELTDRIVAFPRLLRQAGYRNYVTGKWHQGKLPSSDPIEQGFDRSWVMRNGASSYYSAISAGVTADTSTYTNNGRYVDYPTGTYATDIYRDSLIAYLDDHARDHPDRPFFAMASFTAPHWPLQVPPDYRQLYRGRYDTGYDSLRAQRYAGAQVKGLFRNSRGLPPPMPNVMPWVELSPEERRMQSRKMELYAALVTHLDDAVGQLMATLQRNGQYDNTLIVFLSDNGADANDVYANPDHTFLRTAFTNTYDNLGTPESFACYGRGWAQASCGPLYGYKNLTYEGGVAVPLIIGGPGVARSEVVRHELLSIQDLAPTFLALAGTDYPAQWEGRTLAPQRGRSLVDYLAGGPSPHAPDALFATEMAEQAYVRRGRWKLVSAGMAHRDSFQLFDMQTDRAERHDVALEHPATRDSLLADWRAFVNEVGIIREPPQ